MGLPVITEDYAPVSVVIPEPQTKLAIPCDCYHDYSPLEHYLALPTVNVLGGTAVPIANAADATPCFLESRWIASIRGDSPEGFVPPSTRYLCLWCKDHWLASSNPANHFELLRQ